MREITWVVISVAALIVSTWFVSKFPLAAFIFFGIVGAVYIFVGILAFVSWDDIYGSGGIFLGVVYILIGLFVFICLISGLREKK